MYFHATLILNGKTATGIQVPDDVVTQLGAGKRPPVRVTIGEYTYRTTVAPMGGQFWIPVSAENRAGAGIAAGDDFDVEIQVDTEPRSVVAPPDLAAAFEAEPAAKAAFEKLSYSNQRLHVLSVEDAKTPETRRRRVDKVLAALRDGK
jgi:hypothetical protein